MAKKQFFLSVSMLKPEQLKKIKYRMEDKGEVFSQPASFPSLPMIEGNIDKSDDFELIAILTDDEYGRCRDSYEKMKQELKQLSDFLEIDLTITKEIVLSHNESRSKQVELFKKMSEAYKEKCEIYMDLTYGTKITSIGLFASLVYAERVKNCNIKAIVYGKYNHDDGDIGELYDVLSLYELNMLINTSYAIPGSKVEKMIEMLWVDQCQ